MDYWCALWFWPIQKSKIYLVASSGGWKLAAMLEGNIVDVAPQAEIDFVAEHLRHGLGTEVSTGAGGFDSQLQLATSRSPDLHDKFGQLRISRLRQHFSRVAQVEATCCAVGSSCTGNCAFPTSSLDAAASTWCLVTHRG